MATAPQSFNRYSYVQNDPVNFIDPLGLLPAAGLCGAGSSFEDCHGSGGGGFWGGGFNLNDRPLHGPRIVNENPHSRDVHERTTWWWYQFEEGEDVISRGFETLSWQESPLFVSRGAAWSSGGSRPGGGGVRLPGPVRRPPLSYTMCFNSFKFSSNFTGTARTVAEVIEVGSQLSLLGDMAASAHKVNSRSAYIGGTKNRYASGLNYLFRRVANAVGSPKLKGTLTGVGNKVTPALAVPGAFTGGYNVSVALQCATGVLN
jgi:hypothetical protein